MPIKLFISKPIDEVEDLRLLCEQKGWTLVARSFLNFEPKVFNWDGKEDVIFFSSPRAVDFFKAQHSLPKSKTYACAGEKTGEKLMENGVNPSFIAKRSGKVTDMAKAFAAFAKNKRVIFPISNLSRQSYSQYLPKGGFRFVQVYETKINAATVEECDLYVFTSPSNIKGFLLNNPLPSKPTISWGETTSKVLMQQGFEIFKELDISSIDNLIEILTILKNSDIKSCNL